MTTWANVAFSGLRLTRTSRTPRAVASASAASSSSATWLPIGIFTRRSSPKGAVTMRTATGRVPKGPASPQARVALAHEWRTDRRRRPSATGWSRWRQ